MTLVCTMADEILRLFYHRDLTAVSWESLRPYNDDVVRLQMVQNDQPHGFLIDIYCGTIITFGASFDGYDTVIETPICRGWLPLDDNNNAANVISRRLQCGDTTIDVCIISEKVDTITANGSVVYQHDDARLLCMFAYPDAVRKTPSVRGILITGRTVHSATEHYEVNKDGKRDGVYIAVGMHAGSDGPPIPVPAEIHRYTRGEKCETYISDYKQPGRESTFWYVQNINNKYTALLYNYQCKFTGVQVLYHFEEHLIVTKITLPANNVINRTGAASRA